MNSYLLFFLIYSVALACLAFLGGAWWQFQKMKYNEINLPPLPVEVKPEPIEMPDFFDRLRSPYAPKPKRTIPHSSANTPIKETVILKRGQSAVSPATKPFPTETANRLPDIGWGLKNGDE